MFFFESVQALGLGARVSAVLSFPPPPSEKEYDLDRPQLTEATASPCLPVARLQRRLGRPCLSCSRWAEPRQTGALVRGLAVLRSFAFAMHRKGGSGLTVSDNNIKQPRVPNPATNP